MIDMSINEISMPSNVEDSKPDSVFLTRSGASEYLGQKHALQQAPQTLAKLAVGGIGPRFMRSGRQVLYATADLDAWAHARLRGPFRSTSDAAVSQS